MVFCTVHDPATVFRNCHVALTLHLPQRDTTGTRSAARPPGVKRSRPGESMADRSAHIFGVAGRRGGSMGERGTPAIQRTNAPDTFILAAVLAVGVQLTGCGPA